MKTSRFAKIGISSDPDQRVRQLQTGNAEEVTLVAVYWFFSRSDTSKFEKDFHNKFQNFHVNGEWFQLKVDSAKRVIEAILQSGDFSKPVVALTAAENEIANTRWKRSAKKNLYSEIRGVHVVVFNKKGSYSFCIDSRFSTNRYSTEGEAKYAAIAALLGNFPH